MPDETRKDMDMKMDAPIEIAFENDPDYVPFSIKLIVVWLYFFGLFYLGNIFLIDSRGLVINGGHAIYGCLAIYSAYGLGYKRNASRVTAIVLTGFWFLPYVIIGCILLLNLQIITHGTDFWIDIWGIKFTADTLIPGIVFLVLINIMQIYTIVTLMRPQVVKIFQKTSFAN